MERFIITVARETGSGGHNVTRRLSEALGIPYYDRDLLRKASEVSGIHERLFGAADERIGLREMLSAAEKVYTGEILPPDSDDYTSDDNLFNYQAKVIKELAAKESCVIIGRCADYILKDYPNVVSVFVHADKKFCLDRAMERHSMDEKEMQKYIEKTDNYRGDFYRYHTGHEWADARNYDLCLNSGKLGFQKCVEEIKSYIRIRFDQ